MSTGTMIRRIVPTTRTRTVIGLLLLLVAAGSAVAIAAESETSVHSVAAYLTEWELDRSRWTPLEAAGPWDAARQSLVLKLMARLSRVPADTLAAWQAAATAVSQALPTAAADAFVRIEGRGVFIAPQRLAPEDAAIAGRAHLDMVRVATADGRIVDVILESAPLAWPRWTAIDEPVAVVGLPLTTGPGPVPEADGQTWPSEPHALLLLGSRLSWYPATTLLGSLGMDYATFDTVADGRPLVAGDTEAFYGMLAAAGRAEPEVIAATTGTTDIIPLIDPAEKWFATHRGDPVTIEGIARRATRIAIDDPARRQQVGADHYWELYVFVPTPLIRVNDTLQDDFPIVCCVRSLPADMPTGDRISEQVKVSGFALKRYAYPLQRMRVVSPQGDEETGGGRRETPLLIGLGARWTPAPSPRQISNDIGWVLAGIAAVVGLLLGAAAWAASRSARRQEQEARERLPDQIDLHD
jgi:hypothetical protein